MVSLDQVFGFEVATGTEFVRQSHRPFDHARLGFLWRKITLHLYPTAVEI
jgi:hypothetical protein